MHKKQRLARAGMLTRTEPDLFFADDASHFSYLPAVLMADGAESLTNAHRAVFPDDDMNRLADEVENAYDEEVERGQLHEDTPLPLKCRQVPLPRIRGYSEFHLTDRLDRERASLFADKGSVDPLKADLGRLGKDLGWPWMKAPAMRALQRKWAHEPKAVAFLEEYIDRPFTHAEMNGARTSGGIPNVNAAQEAAIRCLLRSPARAAITCAAPS
jgi:hypothetical protein